MRRLAPWVCWLTCWLTVGAEPARLRAQDVPAPPTEPTPDAASPDEPATYSARARTQREPQIATDATQPTEAETAVLQADLGSSFSLAESLPGSVPVFSGVPYLIVRGATPAATATYYDDLLIPSLFHIALGPAVVNPHLLGTFEFHPGVASSRYGRHTGGTLAAGPPRSQRSDYSQRELELTLLDASGYLYVPEIRTTVAWRIGDPGLLMNVLGLDATLNYYDYQVRHEASLGTGLNLVLFALGAGDELGDRVVPEDDISLTFHRVMARLTQRTGATTFGSQLVLGFDASMLGRELNGEAVRAIPSVFVEHAPSSRFKLRAGADLIGTHVSIRRRRGLPTTEEQFDRGQSLSLDPEDFIDGQPYSSLPVRGTGGIYAEVSFEPIRNLNFELGARGDLWLTGSKSEIALSPNVRVRYSLTPELTLYAGAGFAHAPHGSPVPLPALGDISIDAGLERALQAEAGVNWRPFSDLQLEAAYFHHRYYDVVYLELILDCPGNTDPNAAQSAIGQGSVCRGTGLPTADGLAQGVELFVKRDLTERIAGFVSYTVSFAEAIALDGTPFTPQSDVRHLVNAVLRFDLGAGFVFGARLHYRSGKMGVNTLFDTINGRFERVEQRLPSFARLDVQASYSWDVSFGRLQAMIGVQNVTASSEAMDRDCLFDPDRDTSNGQLPVICRIDYQRAILLPNLGIRAEM